MSTVAPESQCLQVTLKQRRQRWGWGVAGLVDCLRVTNPWAPFPAKNQVWCDGASL